MSNTNQEIRSQATTNKGFSSKTATRPTKTVIIIRTVGGYETLGFQRMKLQKRDTESLKSRKDIKVSRTIRTNLTKITLRSKATAIRSTTTYQKQTRLPNKSRTKREVTTRLVMNEVTNHLGEEVEGATRVVVPLEAIGVVREEVSSDQKDMSIRKGSKAKAERGILIVEDKITSHPTSKPPMSDRITTALNQLSSREELVAVVEVLHKCN